MEIKFRTIKVNGKSLVEEFIDSLPQKDRNKLLEVMQKTQEKGIDIAIRMKWVKKLSDNLYELRSQQSNNIQRVIYFHLYELETGSNYILTHGYTKKTRTIPKSEIERGIRIRDDFLGQPSDVLNEIFRKWKDGDRHV